MPVSKLGPRRSVRLQGCCGKPFRLDNRRDFSHVFHMKTAIRLLPITITVVLSCLVFLAKAFPVVPQPDGGYPGFNTAEGQKSLFSLTTGVANTAVGWFSLQTNIDGSFNTGIGAGTLLFNVGNQSTGEGVENTAIGAAALLFNTTGFDNTAVGAAALLNNTTGNGNISLGADAGISLTTGDNNIDIGNDGVAGESSTIRIGDPAVHETIFVAGIIPMSPAAPIEAMLVDPITGQLGSADVGSFPPGPQGPPGPGGPQGPPGPQG